MSSSHEAVEQAISFLTTPLSKTTVSSHAINILRSHLTASLLTLSARSGPVGVSLRLAAAAPPPECIGRACDVSGVNWSEWLFLIGGGMGLDLDVNVTPTAVTASFCRAGTPSLGLVTVWQKEEPTRHLSTRELLYADDDAEELFNEINRSQHSPSWLSSWGLNGNAASYVRQPSALSSPMPVPKMHAVPPTARSSHSRSSSHASSNAGHSPNAPYAQHGQHQGQAYYGGERASSACSNHSASSNHSGRSSEDGSTGSSGALSWTRRGTVVPGPQQSAILAARNAHALQQQQAQHQQQAQQQQLAYQQFAPMPHHHGHSPSPSITSLASVSSTGSGGSGGKQHRRQRSTSGNGTTAAVVDPSKASVTAYDGGKTKVMTGGVMLGAVTSGNKKKRAY